MQAVMDKRSILFIALMSLSFFGINQYFSKQQEVKTKELIQNKKTSQTITTKPVIEIPEKGSYYVLQNDYQQLVFSTQGGALKEINLTIKGLDNEQSPINPIQVDKTMKDKHPQNDYFPQKPYFIFKDGQKKEITEGELNKFYPLIRRSLYQDDGTLYKNVAPKYYALNILSNDQSTENSEYRVTRFEKDIIQFELTQSQRRIIKTFYLPENPKAPYVFEAKIQINGDKKDLWLSSGVPEVELTSGKFSPVLKYEFNKGKKTVVENSKLPDTSMTNRSISPNWISNSNGFFGLIINPLEESNQGYQINKVSGTTLPSRITLIDTEYDLYPAKDYPGYNFFIPLSTSSMAKEFRVYAGPYESDYLLLADKVYSDSKESKSTNYAKAKSFQGFFSFISEPFAKFLFFLMAFFHKFTHSWGLSIILLTIALKFMLYPLNSWHIKANARLQEIAPLTKAIQEKYKKDPKRAQIEIMRLYQEKKANPFMGCFPVIIQMPFLFGMFDLLKSTFELRGASFIPGWIDNLAAPDVLFSWNSPVFFFGTQFHLLPFLLGAVMYLQQKFTSKLPKDKSKWTDQQRQQKGIGTFIAIIFTFFFYKFPSGLNIYWLSSSLLGILQNWYSTKKIKKTPAVPVSAYYSKKGKKR
jgi:YidC/Oxa1 family membrane protein insertase